MNSNIRFIKKGEPVTAETANRPLRDIEQMLSALSTALDNYTDIGSNALYDQPLSDDVYIGAPVFFNPATGVYDLARASAHTDNGKLVADECSNVVGIVTEKTTINTGHILLHGIKQVDLSNSATETVPGVYFLSSAQPGKLVRQQPSVSIPVCLVLAAEDNRCTIFVAITFDKLLSGHNHYTFSLNNVPAGDFSGGTFTNPDTNIDGWLPAAMSPVAPADAVLFYNIPKSSLKTFFPPAVSDLFRLYWTVNADGVPITAEVPRRLYRVTYDGIWWLSDALPPWQTNIDFADGVPAGVLTRTMEAWYLSLSFGGNNAVVESLKPELHSGLEIYQENDAERKPAHKGALKVDLDLNLKRIEGDVEPGYTVLKDIRPLYDADGKLVSKSALYFGPVVSGIKVNSRSIAAKSRDNVYSGGYAQGNVELDLSDSWYGTELEVESIHLDNMMDSTIGEVRGITFYSSSASGFSGQVDIPSQLPENANAALRFVFVAQNIGTYSSGNFTFKYKVIPPVADDSVAPFPMSVIGGSLTIGASGTVTTDDAYQMFTAKSNPIEVMPGGMLWFSLRKNTGLDNLTVIRQNAVLSKIETP